jgi:hypothetical protein
MKTGRIAMKYKNTALFGEQLCWIFLDGRWGRTPGFGSWGLTKTGLKELKFYLV